MTKKFYVIALGKSYLPGFTGIDKGMIISGHSSSSVAREQADKHNAHNQVTSSYKPLFAVTTSDSTLKKGEFHPDLADQWIAQDYDDRATFLMKCILDPIWRGGKPLTDQAVADRMEDLNLSLEELRIRYQDRARAELDIAGANLIANAERTARIHATQKDLQGERSQFTYTFPAVAGLQAGRAYYVAQVPLSALVKLFRFDEEDVVPAELRAQRLLNERRGEAIGKYIVENPKDYVLPAITASVSAEMAFEPVAVTGASGSIGLLHIPMEATLLINDGQHRRHGIERAIKEQPQLAKETIAVTIFFDQGLERSQQMFADINGRQVKPSSAINALYDRRNPYNKWVLETIKQIPGVSARVDMENSSVAGRSYKLWSLVAFKKSLSLLTGVTEATIGDLDESKLAAVTAYVVEFFAQCAKHIPDWRDMVTGKVAAMEVREHLVIGHAVWLEGLAVFGRQALFQGIPFELHGRLDEGVVRPELANWHRMEKLGLVDSRKVSRMWDRRCVVMGKMQKTSDGVQSTATKLLMLANVDLQHHQLELEKRLAA